MTKTKKTVIEAREKKDKNWKCLHVRCNV